MVRIERTTRQRFTFAKHSFDIMLDAEASSGDGALNDEDVRVIGPFSDFRGSKTVNSRTQQQWGGHENEFWGTTAQIEAKQDLDNLTEVGTSASINRRRRKKIFLRLD